MKKIILLALLVQMLVFVPAHGQDIFKAIMAGDLDQVKSILLNQPEALNAQQNQMGLTPAELAFMVEIQKKKMEIAPYLIEKGAAFDVNKIGRSGYTALDMAIIFGYREAVEYLMARGADIQSIRERDGKTPLINAITRNREEIALVLIRSDAGIDIPDRNGIPPIYYAVKKGFLEATQEMLARKSDAHFKDASGRSLLQVASLYGFLDIVDILLRENIEVNAQDLNGHTALYYASKYGHERVARRLADCGASKKGVREKNFRRSKIMTKVRASGEAAAWYLSNRGWAVKTKNHLLVFDSEEFGVRRPTEPRLANGFISPCEVVDQNIVALYTAYHGEIGEPAYIHTIEDSVSTIHYIHNKLDRWRGSENTFYMEAGETRNIENMQVSAITIQEEMPVLGYWCQVDGVTLFYSGFRPENTEKFKNSIESLARTNGKADLIFFPIAEEKEKDDEWMILIAQLQPKMIIPLDPDRREYLFPQVKDLMQQEHIDVKVFCAENPGDHFFFINSRKW